MNETITLYYYILVYRFANQTRIFRSKVLPRIGFLIMADVVLYPGEYPKPFKDRYSMISNNHPDLDVSLWRLSGSEFIGAIFST